VITGKNKYVILLMDHAKKTYVGLEKKIHPFLISKLEGGGSIYLLGKELP
jgi:hypothetical protein